MSSAHQVSTSSSLALLLLGQRSDDHGAPAVEEWSAPVVEQRWAPVVEQRWAPVVEQRALASVVEAPAGRALTVTTGGRR